MFKGDRHIEAIFACHICSKATQMSLVVRKCLFISQNPCRKGCVRGTEADTSPQPLLSCERSAFLLVFDMAKLRGKFSFRCHTPLNMSRKVVWQDDLKDGVIWRGALTMTIRA